MIKFNGLNGAIKKLWTDTVTIKSTKAVKKGAVTSSETVTIADAVPAKLILKSTKASQQGFYGTDDYDAELLIDVGIDVPAGSTVEVTDTNGKVTKYKRSSKGYSGYQTHQEIALVRVEKA